MYILGILPGKEGFRKSRKQHKTQQKNDHPTVSPLYHLTSPKKLQATWKPPEVASIQPYPTGLSKATKHPEPYTKNLKAICQIPSTGSSLYTVQLQRKERSTIQEPHKFRPRSPVPKHRTSPSQIQTPILYIRKQRK
jgi:hypothetical protein